LCFFFFFFFNVKENYLFLSLFSLWYVVDPLKVINILFDSNNTGTKVFRFTSGTKVVSSTSTSSFSSFCFRAQATRLARVRITGSRNVAPLTSPATRARTTPFSLDKSTGSTVPAVLESAIGFNEIAQHKFTIVSNSSSRAETHDITSGVYQAASVSSTRVRRATSGNFASFSEPASSTSTGIGTRNGLGASSTVLAGSAK